MPTLMRNEYGDKLCDVQWAGKILTIATIAHSFRRRARIKRECMNRGPHRNVVRALYRTLFRILMSEPRQWKPVPNDRHKSLTEHCRANTSYTCARQCSDRTTRKSSLSLARSWTCQQADCEVYIARDAINNCNNAVCCYAVDVRSSSVAQYTAHLKAKYKINIRKSMKRQKM